MVIRPHAILRLPPLLTVPVSVGIILSSLLMSLLLLAIVELVSNTIVLHARANYMLKPIVVPLNFKCVCNDGLYSIVVTHHLHLIDNTKLIRA